MTEIMDLLLPGQGRDLGRIGYEYRVRVGGLSFDRCEAADVDYDRDGSASARLVITDDGLLSGSSGEMVSAFVKPDSDSSFEEYFTGEAKFVRYDPETGQTTIEAFGPRESLSGTFGEAVLYRGVDLGSFVGDIRRRLGPKLPRVRVVGGERVRIQDSAYNREVEFGEALEDFTESVGYVVADRPGYVLLVSPAPRPGESVSGEEAVSLGPGDFSPGGLKIDPVDEGPYYAVGAFRREEGREVWSLTVRVRGAQERGAHPTNIKWLTDFEGDYASAKQQCYALADIYSRGRFRGTARGIIPRVIYSGTALRVTRIESERDERGGVRRIRRVYSGSAESVSCDLVAGEMDITFAAERLADFRIPEARAVEVASSHVISSEDVEVNNVDADGVGAFFVIPPVVPEGEAAWYREDEIGLYIDMDAAEDRAGEDEIGGWVDLDA